MVTKNHFRPFRGCSKNHTGEENQHRWNVCYSIVHSGEKLETNVLVMGDWLNELQASV